MDRRLLALLFLLVLKFEFSEAQQVLVLDSESKQPLHGVLIYSTDPGLSFTSDSKGEAEIGKLANQSTIIFQILGFESLTVSWQNLIEKHFKVELIPSQITLDIAVISASRWRQNTQDLSRKVRSLSPEQLTIRNPANTADWLGSSGEVFVQKSQGNLGSE